MNTQYGTRYRLDMNRFEKQTTDIIVEPSKETPFVKYSRAELTFMIKGTSVRAEIQQFYEPLVSKVKAHLNEGLDLDIILFFSMINPTTAKVLFDLFRFVRVKKNAGIKVNVTWCSESSNEEMHETGEDFAGIYDLDF